MGLRAWYRAGGYVGEGISAGRDGRFSASDRGDFARPNVGTIVRGASPTSAVPGLISRNSPCFPHMDLKSWHYIFLRRTHARRQPQTVRQLESQVA